LLLSLEIPTPHLREFLPLTDFGFGLAQLYLDETQKEYHKLMQGCLLDNGMYELNDPLRIPELIQAAILCKPEALIAPDWMNDMTRTLNATIQLVFATEKFNADSNRLAKDRWAVGGVVQGRNLKDRVECFRELVDLGCEPICFPFRTPRDETIDALLASGELKEDCWYHLLGLQRIEELVLKRPGKWSIDTGKPFKGFRMDQLPIRGHGRLALHEPLTEKAHKAALWNIAYMRRVMQNG